MSERSERVRLATAALQASVMDMPVAGRPLNEQLPVDVWSQLGRASIGNWVEDAGRSCGHVANALDRVDELGRTDETLGLIETALWRIDACREKLEAVFVLSFGVPSLEPYGKSARFEPNTDGIRTKLRELSTNHAAAREFAEVARSLATHPTVRLRNQLSHQLAPIGSAVESCWIDVAHLKRGGILYWDGGPFYVEGTLDHDDIGEPALWSRAVGGVTEAFELLVRSTELMAQLVRDVGALAPPQRLYKEEETGKVTVHNPRFPEVLPPEGTTATGPSGESVA